LADDGGAGGPVVGAVGRGAAGGAAGAGAAGVAAAVERPAGAARLVAVRSAVPTRRVCSAERELEPQAVSVAATATRVAFRARGIRSCSHPGAGIAGTTALSGAKHAVHIAELSVKHSTHRVVIERKGALTS